MSLFQTGCSSIHQFNLQGLQHVIAPSKRKNLTAPLSFCTLQRIEPSSRRCPPLYNVNSNQHMNGGQMSGTGYDLDKACPFSNTWLWIFRELGSRWSEKSVGNLATVRPWATFEITRVATPWATLWKRKYS